MLPSVMHARIRRMELTTEELAALMDWATQLSDRRHMGDLGTMQKRIDIATAERDAAIAERDALQAEKDSATAAVGRLSGEPVILPPGWRLSALNPNEQHLQSYDEVVEENARLQHDLTTARLHNDDLVRDLEEARAQRDSTKAPAGSILLTEAELADVIGNAITAQRHGRVPQQSAANAVRQYHERNA